jgi:hypothetical protein
MTQISPFESRALRILEKKLNERRDINAAALASGNARVASDAFATAQNYCEAVGYMRAIGDVLSLLEEVEDELVGRNRTPIERN